MNNTKRNFNKTGILFCLLLFGILISVGQKTDRAAANMINAKTYTVSSTTKPLNIKYTKYSTYTKYTKQYYMLRSYLEQLEKNGGTLTLSAGTYSITNTLYIPSNVTLRFKNGVIIKKLDKTGVSTLKSSKSIFQLVSPSKAGMKGVYGGYRGEKDIHITGTGTVIMDLSFDTDCLGIMMGHNTNVSISGITFQNMKGGHFIELDASQNVTIENNRFLHHRASATGIKEAINLDTPDKNTDGFHAVWTNYDCTANKDILIQNNQFDDLERAIGTHKYSEGKYHTNVKILNNKIANIDSDAIRILNWTDPVIQGNEIKNVAGGTDDKRAILASGVSNPTITDNTFINVARAIQIMPWKNSGAGSQYGITYNDISSDNISLMKKNTLNEVSEEFFRINKEYNNYTSNTDKYYFEFGDDEE